MKVTPDSDVRTTITDQTLVSVVLPIRDWRHTSALAIESILQQSHKYLELLLVGQRKLDLLDEQLRLSGIRDDRIRLVARERTGIVSALNAGLRAASGQFIARMDDDDIAYPHRIATQLSYLRTHPHIHLCAACIRFIDADGTSEGIAMGNRRYQAWLNKLTEPATIAHACFAENPLPHPTLLAHRDVWMTLGGYHDVDGPEDHDLVLRAMLSGLQMGKPVQQLLDWREHPERLTHTDKRYSRNAFIAQSARAWVQHRTTENASPAPPVWIAGTGKHARSWHDALHENGVHVRGFVDMHRPGPARRKRLLPVITYDELATKRSDEQLVCAVTQPDAVKAVREFFTQQGWHEGKDYIVG